MGVDGEELNMVKLAQSADAANLFVVAAPSGAGKTSLVAQLVQQLQHLHLSISYTTRPARADEVDGEDYHFVSKAQFEQMIDRGEFLEHAEVYGNYYGTSRLWVQQQLEQGRDIILEIDWQGARQIRHFFPRHALLIFILPPSVQALQQRLLKRQQDTDVIVRQRMQVAQDEMGHYKEFDYLVINDDFEQALASLSCIVQAARCNILRQLSLQQPLISSLLDSK